MKIVKNAGKITFNGKKIGDLRGVIKAFLEEKKLGDVKVVNPSHEYPHYQLNLSYKDAVVEIGIDKIEKLKLYQISKEDYENLLNEVKFHAERLIGWNLEV